MTNSVIAAQMYTVREFMQTPEDTVEACRKVADIGYQVVELAGSGNMETPQLADLLGDLGLTVCSRHIGFDALRDTPEVVAEENRLLSCEWVVSGPSERPTTAGGWVQFAREASDVAKKLGALGLKYAYHNHAFELERFGERTGLDILYDESDPGLVNAPD